MMKTHPTDVGEEGKAETSVLLLTRAMMLLNRWEDSQTPVEKGAETAIPQKMGKGKEYALLGFLGGYGFLGNDEKGLELKHKRKRNLQIENKTISDKNDYGIWVSLQVCVL